MKITKKRLRKLIRESILSEMLPPGHPVPRSVEADYDIASKEDTFPKRKLKKPKAPTTKEKQTYEKIVTAITDIAQAMPGFKSHMAGQAVTVDLPVEEVAKELQLVLVSLGTDIADGKSGEGSIAISHPSAPEIRMYIFQITGTFADPNTPTTEIDFGLPPGEGEPY